MTSYKYLIVFAHADTRTSGGELTEDTMKGYGNVQVETDHEIVTQADKDEIAKQIGRSQLNEDGSTRYTHISVMEIKRLDEAVTDDADQKKLTAEDFTWRFSDDLTLQGIPLGQDDLFAYWGHEISVEDAKSEVQKYWDATVGNDKYADEYTTDNIPDSYFRRVWAVPTFVADADDWSLEWANKNEYDEGAIPLSLLQLP